jgi:Uma2 family endonuclease
MATVIEAKPPAGSDDDSEIAPREHVLLRGISWGTYEALVYELEGNRRLSLTYDDGDLEIMSPSGSHEWRKRLLGRMVETYTEVLGIPICSLGSTTFKLELQAKGLEPDECYYLQHEELVRSKDDLNLGEDPPPDLAIEVEITSRLLPRMPIYAKLQFPEVWQYSRGKLVVYLLQADGSYSPCRQSKCLPELSLDKLEESLRNRGETDETTWTRAFRQWVRTTIG